METTLGILVVVVAILSVLQGWQVIMTKRNHRNPNIASNPGIGEKLDVIAAQLGRMEQRLTDIWDKIKE